MEELSMTLIYEDLSYFSDSIVCSPEERKDYIKKIREIMSSENEILFFNSGDDVHFFSNGVIKNSIVTITVRPMEIEYVEGR